MEGNGRQEDAAPPWAPSEATAFRHFVGATAAPRGAAEASPRASGGGVAARISKLHGVKRKPFVARLTADIIQTFERCHPEFKYSDTLNPKRFLTHPSTPAHNNGVDNANWDLILYVNLELVNETSNRRFVVKEMLGQGTFGQVVKCWDTETNDYVAVKVIKNQPAFYQQAIVEVSLLKTLNQKFDPDDQHNIVRMLDFLNFQNHLCIAFEMLGQNLYELLKRNHLRGLKVKYVQAFSKQILDAMTVMRDGGIIHCDLKPENILLAPTAKTAAAVKVIDFGSACMEGKTVYSYIQSRYYRSPEVLLGYPYTTAIDMWSFGCIVAELFIGLPLFPGASEYDVLKRMLKILGGQPPDDLLRGAKNTGKFFKHVGNLYPGIGSHDSPGTAYRMLSEEEVEGREAKRPKLGKWYFPQQRLDQLIFTYPWDNTELSETEKADRSVLVDFLRGLLEFDPNKRWSPFQALGHPFITGEPFTGPYKPVSETPKIPVAHAAAVDHNPGGGHWLAAGLSPQVGSVNRCLPPNNPYPPRMPFSYGSSYGSYGSHGSYAGNAGPASSYGSYGDVNNVNMYYSPVGPSGFPHVGTSPDIRLRPRLSYDRGIRLSPGGMGPMSLGTSPSQFTPPNYQMHIPASSHNAPPLTSFDILPDTSAPSTLDPSDWDPNYSDESLLQEDNSLAADLSSSVHLRDATGQPGGSARSTRVQSHNFASSNPIPTSQSYRGDQQIHSSSLGRGTRPGVPITYGDSLWLPAAEMDIPITAWIDTAMEGPVTALLGPMAPLLRQVHSLSAMAPEHIQGGSEGDVKRLKEHLEVLCRDLLEPEETSSVPKWWRKEVRELLYDTEDRLDEVIIFQAGDFSELVAGVDDACERRKRLQLAPNKTTSPDLGEAGLSYFTPQRTSIELSKPISVQGHYASLGVVGIEDPMNKLVEQLAFDDDKQKRLKVIPIVGFPGVGKTTVAGILYYEYREKFHCSAFVRVSRTPDTRSLLISILSQIKAPGLCGFPDVHDLIDGIRKHLEGKRYFIIMDDLWTASIWDIISRSFPDADYGSRIITTTQIDDVALACCRYYPDYIEISPLNDDQSKELFFTRVFGSEDHCPPDFKKVSCKIINKCAGLPLAIVSIANMLASESFLIVEKWEHIQDSLPCTRTNPTSEGVKSLSSDTAIGSGGKMLARGPKIEKWNRTRDSLSFTSEGLKQVLNVVYNNLPPHLKACLLYLCMYPEGYLVRKHDLVRQWVAEDFVNAMGGRGAEETAGVYFDELVSRGMVQPAATNCGNEVLSCTVHHMVLDLIRHKSKELNFIITVDNLQSTLALPDEVRRLSVQFGGSKGADVPEYILISKVRSLLVWGFFECVPSVVDHPLLRVLILHIWADGDETSFDLTSISELLLLRYLKIQCNIMVNLPDEIKGLKCLETLEVDARLSAVPWDIGHLKKLSHLLLPSEAILPKGFDGLTSLLTLGCFDLSKNSTQNVIDLAELTNLQDVHLTFSTEPSELPVGSMKHLGLILEKFNDLRSLTLHGAGSSSQIISDDGLSIVSPSPVLLEKLELLPRICTLSRLPKWIGELSRLSILKIEVLDLSIKDIAILKELASLASLSLSVRTEHAEWIIFDNEGFPVLKYFKFVRTAPYMSFLEGAMPNVQKLKLAFDVNRRPWAYGFQYMTCLKQVSVKFGGASADDSNKRDAERVWKDTFTNHPNNPILDARWVDCIFKGDKTTDVEDTKGHDSRGDFTIPPPRARARALCHRAPDLRRATTSLQQPNSMEQPGTTTCPEKDDSFRKWAC